MDGSALAVEHIEPPLKAAGRRKRFNAFKK